jgi:hypothetical protein
MKINELINLYDEFCVKVEALNKSELSIHITKIIPPTITEIDTLEAKYSLKIPEDIKYFWTHYQQELSISPENYVGGDDFFSAGFDFLELKYIDRDITQDRELGEEYHRQSLDARLHQDGLALSYSEPRIFCDLAGKGAIYFVMYDGDTPKFPIADNFTEFFTHYLAAGCFYSHRFDLYWNFVKDIVPLQIPLNQNKWIKFYSKVYQSNYYKL